MLAEELKTPIFLASRARQYFEISKAGGLKKQDNAFLVKIFEELSSTQIPKE
jgi:hypothetical protein